MTTCQIPCTAPVSGVLDPRVKLMHRGIRHPSPAGEGPGVRSSFTHAAGATKKERRLYVLLHLKFVTAWLSL